MAQNAHRWGRRYGQTASGKRICAWCAKNFLRYVRKHDICESSNRGVAFWARNPSCSYAVWFVVIVVVLMGLAVDVLCVNVPDPQSLCFGTYVLHKLCGAVIGRGAHNSRGAQLAGRTASGAHTPREETENPQESSAALAGKPL